MERVTCTVEECEIESESKSPSRFKRTTPGLCLTCEDCGHAVEVRGREEKSIRYGLALMREECPENMENYYVEE